MPPDIGAEFPREVPVALRLLERLRKWRDKLPYGKVRRTFNIILDRLDVWNSKMIEARK